MDTHMASVDALDARHRPSSSSQLRDGVVGGLLRRLWRGKYVIALFGLASAIGVYVVMSGMPRQFTSEGVVVVETQRIAIPELQGVTTGEGMPDPLPLVRSEMQQLRSRALLREVVDQFNLVSRPEFNPALEGPGLRQRLLAWLRDVLPPDMVAWLPQAGSPRSEEEQEAIVADMLGRQLSTFNDNRSLIIVLGLTARDPQVAAQVLNGIMNRYLAGKVEARTSLNREGNAALTARLAEVRGEVEQAERRVAAQREQYNLVTLRAGSVNQLQLEEMTTAVARAAAERQQAEAAWERARTRRGGNLMQDLADVLNSPTMSRLRERETEAARRVAELANRFGSNHPDRRAAQAELAAVRSELEAEARRIVNSLQTQAQSARDREQGLSRQLVTLREDANRIAAQQADLQNLEREADARRQLYQTLLARVEQTAVDPRGVAPPAGARIVSPASPPANPSGPPVGLATGFALLGGLTFGGVLSLLGAARGLPVTRASEVAAATGVPVIALPRMRDRQGLAMRVVGARQGPEAEALRSLRSGLRLQSRGRIARLILFAAPANGHGATTVSTAFARVAAMDGLKVLLIEGNLREPGVADALDVDPGPGLTAATEGSLSWRQAIRPDPELPMLDLLLAAEPHGSSRRVLESVRFQNLLAEAADDYNMIVLDSAPVSAAADFLVLAHVVEAAVIVVKAGAARMDDVTGALGQIGAANARCATAAVLNGATL